MSTIITTINISESETKSRKELLSLRASHADISTFSQTQVELTGGQSKSITCSKFMYVYVRDPLAILIAPATGGSITLPSVSGVLTFPYACTLTFTPVATSTLKHLITLVTS